MEIVVLMRKFKDKGAIIALFVEEPATLNKYDCQSYMIVGQHQGANVQKVINQTVPATPDEYKPLLRELERIGYTVKVAKRHTARMQAVREVKIEKLQ